MKPLLNVNQVKALLNVSRAFVYELVEASEISHVRVGNAIRFTEDHVAEYVARREKRAGESSKTPPPSSPTIRRTRAPKHLSLD
jgi:putative molybdopterin biosynthesis protein